MTFPTPIARTTGSIGAMVRFQMMVGGHINDFNCMIHSNCQEANLDMQYIMTMSPNSPTTFWYSDKWFSDFFIEIANTVKPPKIISISYGTTELSNLYSASVDRCRHPEKRRKSDGFPSLFTFRFFRHFSYMGGVRFTHFRTCRVKIKIKTQKKKKKEMKK